MKTRLSLCAASAAVITLAGCVSYPVYQPVPVARLTPAQSAALASRPLDPTQRDQYAQASADAARDDVAVVPYTYAYPVTPYYGYGYYGGYPYYGGYYPWYPGLSLSLGFRGGYRGGWRGGGGWHGGGGFHGHR